MSRYRPYRYLIILLAVLFAQMAISQPVKYSKKTIRELDIYEDLKDARRFYYAPGALYLEEDKDGKPTFKLIQMRYTGTAATGDQGEMRFMNIVQFKVMMHQPGKADIDQVKKELGRLVKLFPLALKNMEAYLVAPFEGKYKRIGNSGSFQSDGKLGDGSKTSYWTERTYTVRLENHEAQLLWDMVENGNLTFSVSYTYYADMIGEIKVDAGISGSPSSGITVNEQMGEITQLDSIPTLQILRTEAFNIDVDVSKYPEILVQKDLNEGVPPAYPALEVLCFDFTDNLRPDLAMKTIEFEAMGVSDRPVKLRSKKFLNTNTDQHTRQIRFPYAVNMRKPLRYRVKEYSKTGDNTDSGWITRKSWVGAFDITSRIEDMSFEKRTIEFETNPNDFSDLGIEKLLITIRYIYQEEQREEAFEFTETSIALVPVSLIYDKRTVISFRPEWIYTSGNVKRGLKKIISIDNYAYIDFEKGE